MPNPTPPDVEQPDPELPRGVALAWGIAAHPQRGPKRELSIERIVEAAIEIADAEGLGAVSMSRVATSLGFTTMSLYRYVTSKDDLILLMQEEASVVPVPDEAVERSWRDGVSAWVLAMRDAYRAHPWLVDIPISGAPITPNSLTIVDWFLREMRDLPLSDGEKMSALLLVTSYVRATSAQERDLGAAAAASDPGDVTGENAFGALVELVTPERFPYLQPLLVAGGLRRRARRGRPRGRRRLRVRPPAHPRRDRVPRRPSGVGASRRAPRAARARDRPPPRQARARGGQGQAGGREGAPRGAEARARGHQARARTRAARTRAAGARARRTGTTRP